MHVKREIGAKGQVVLPKDIRDYLGIKDGSQIAFEIIEGNVIIKPLRTGKEFVEYYCNTNSKKSKKHMGIKKLKKILDEQYELH